MNPVEKYLLSLIASAQSIMLYVRSVIKNNLPEVAEKYSYKIPFYYYNKKPMLYLNILKGTNYVDVAFIDGNLLEEKYPNLKNDNKRKRVRSIQVETLEDFSELEFIELLKSASELLNKK